MKTILRKALRFFCRHIKLRGRHKLAFGLGKKIMPAGGRDTIRIGEINLPIDHNIPMYRYVYYGIYEEEFVAFLKRTIKPGDAVIDPGANVGYISAVLAELVGKSGKVISIEPSRKCYNMLVQYLVTENIALLNTALYSGKTTKKFIDKENVIGNGYAAFNEYTGKKPGDDLYEIETVTVKGLFEQYNLGSVKFLKLDIEGAELPALQGCGNLLKEKKIDYILVESNFIPSHREVNLQIQELLMQAGYRPFIPQKNKTQAVQLADLEGKRIDVIWSHLPG